MNAHLPRQSVSIQDDEWGTFCYTHHHIKATHRICSEADSFGAEYYNMCDECWDEYQAAIKAKLEDPEYVKSYARGTYMLSKEGEQIFYLPSGE